MPDIQPVGRQRYQTINTVNLLFLGDGFHGSEDQKLFWKSVEKISHRIRNVISPFNMRGLKERINVFAVYVDSQSSGISCTEYIDADGKIVALDAGVGKLATKQTAFGLAYAGDRVIKPLPEHEDDILNFIATLSHPKKSSGGSAIPDCWGIPTANDPARPYWGKDLGLVFILVNDDVYGGSTIVKTDVHYAAAISLGDGSKFNGLSSTGTKDPDGNEIFDHTPVSRRNKHNQIADVVAHEMGHTRFGLADEYANDFKFGSENWIDLKPNVTSTAEARRGGTPWTSIKWDRPRYPGSTDPTIQLGVSIYISMYGPLFAYSPCPPPGWADPPLPGVVPIGQRPTPPPPSLEPKLKGQYRNKLIGIYEGGDTQYCGIYRPAGDCKMRSLGNWRKVKYRYEDFCYVCKYEIVNAIDPNLLSNLANGQYPGSKDG